MIVNIDEAAELFLERAVSFAQAMGSHDVGTEHVLFVYMTWVPHQDLEQDGLTAGKVVDAIGEGVENNVSWELTRPQATNELMDILNQLDHDAARIDAIASVDNIMYAILDDAINKACNIVFKITHSRWRRSASG